MFWVIMDLILRKVFTDVANTMTNSNYGGAGSGHYFILSYLGHRPSLRGVKAGSWRQEPMHQSVRRAAY